MKSPDDQVTYPDRFELHDYLHLKESINGRETGRVIGPLTITHILDNGYGMPEGYCMLSFQGDLKD